MMKSAAALLALMLSTSPALAEPPRVAVLRVGDVVQAIETTLRTAELLKAKREEINKDPRLASSNAMYSELQLRRNQLKSNAKIDLEARKKLEREYAVKAEEANALRADFVSYQTAKNREIDAEMVTGRQQRLALIRQTAEKIAAEEGFDWILDSSGNTNTGVPLLLCAKNATDLTDRVVALLNNPTPPPEPPPAAENNR
jgi:Skp family chaperone for outer membrane proteins